MISVKKTKEGFALYKGDKRISPLFSSIFFSKNTKSYLAKKDNKMAIFLLSQMEPVSDWWNFISKTGFISGNSIYYVAENDKGKKALCSIASGKKPISPWFDLISCSGVLKGETIYYTGVINSKTFLFSVKSKEPISGKFEKLDIYDLIENHIPIFIGQKTGKYFLYYLNEKTGNSQKLFSSTKLKDVITFIEKNIYTLDKSEISDKLLKKKETKDKKVLDIEIEDSVFESLFLKESKTEMTREIKPKETEKKEHFFIQKISIEKDEDGFFLSVNGEKSEVFEKIIADSVIEKKSMFYLGIKDGKYFLYSIKDPSKPIFSGLYISENGIVSGDSNFFLAIKKFPIKALYRVIPDGKVEQVSPFTEEIICSHTLAGKSIFYALKENNLFYVFPTDISSCSSEKIIRFLKNGYDKIISFEKNFIVAEKAGRVILVE